VIDPDVLAFYANGRERERLTADGGTLELIRTQELLRRVLPPAPAVVLDVGGGPGVYAAWLARAGYDVHLVDPVPLHVTQATELAASQPEHPFTAAVGDARRLDLADSSADVVLLLGPLYHLTERADRVRALREAHRVLRPGGLALAVAISRFAMLLDALQKGILADPAINPLIMRMLATGQHRNPGLPRHPGWFTTAYLHRPEDLATEIVAGGFRLEALLGVEGPAGFVGAGWAEPSQREAILAAARQVEAEPSLLGLSGHLLAVGRKGHAAERVGSMA
jgi:SAM-dependent methyltransferase